MPESPVPTLLPVNLLPLTLHVQRRPGPLLPQIEAALAVHGRPLRWAITAVQGEELVLEAVLVVAP